MVISLLLFFPHSFLLHSIFSNSHLSMFEAWLSNWRLQVNETKSAQVTFTNRKIDCPHVTLYGFLLPAKHEVKYVGPIFDRSLTWRLRILAKKNHIDHKIRQMYWLIGRKSQLTTENNSEIIPTRCNNCVYSSQWLYSTCFG